MKRQKKSSQEFLNSILVQFNGGNSDCYQFIKAWKFFFCGILLMNWGKLVSEVLKYIEIVWLRNRLYNPGKKYFYFDLKIKTG